MGNPTEPGSARIVPLLRRDPLPAPARQTPRRRALGIDAFRADHLQQIDALTRNLPGEDAGLHHLRAVELACSSGAFYPHTPTEETPGQARARGLSTIEIMLQTAGEYQPAFIADLAARARANHVIVHSVHTMGSLHPMLSPYARRAREGRDLFRLAIRAAATLGAHVLVWHGPHRTEVCDHAGWEAFIRLSRELAAECGQAGLTLAIENVATGALAQVRDVTRFANRLSEIGRQDEIGFVFDPFQAVEAQANPFMMLAAMGNRIVDVHISDYREEAPHLRHLLPGDGDLPWSALIRAIVGSGYTGPMIIEGPLGTDDIAIARVRDRLNPLIRSIFTFSPDAHRRDDETVTLLPDHLPEGVRDGIRLFNARDFFAQHEVLEAEWHAERRPVRRLYQGILQIGVGFYHAGRGNHSGAVALLESGLQKLEAFSPSTLGIDVAALETGTRACLEQLVRLGPGRLAEFDTDLIPTISEGDDTVQSITPQQPDA